MRNKDFLGLLAHQDTPVEASATITPSAASIAHRPWMSSFSRKRSSENTSLYGDSACSLLTCTAAHWECEAAKHLSPPNPHSAYCLCGNARKSLPSSASRTLLQPQALNCASESAKQFRRRNAGGGGSPMRNSSIIMQHARLYARKPSCARAHLRLARREGANDCAGLVDSLVDV